MKNVENTKKKLQLHPQTSATYPEPVFTNFTFDHVDTHQVITHHVDTHQVITHHVDTHHVDTLHTLFHLHRSRNMESTGRNSFIPSPPCRVFCTQEA